MCVVSRSGGAAGWVDAMVGRGGGRVVTAGLFVVWGSVRKWRRHGWRVEGDACGLG